MSRAGPRSGIPPRRRGSSRPGSRPPRPSLGEARVLRRGARARRAEVVRRGSDARADPGRAREWHRRGRTKAPTERTALWRRHRTSGRILVAVALVDELERAGALVAALAQPGDVVSGIIASEIGRA